MIYYVMSLGYTKKVVTGVTQDFLSYIVHSEELGLVIKSFARCETLKEARRIRKEVGGIILQGVKE